LDIEAIDHISINCADFTASCEFYGGVLGFERLQTVDCGEFEITYFRLPGGARLELFDYHGRSPLVERAESEGGLRHLAFRVKDVAARERELRSAGVEITLPTCDLPNLGARVLLCLDPNGVTLEFCQPL
jgi:catechol 2,3-dioxygenase-like lactoylglutathione lyase family enzyme